MGVDADRLAASVLAGVVGLLGAAWRLAIGRRYADVGALSAAELNRAERELEGNAAAASGVLWAVATIWIYPYLQGTTSTTYVSMIFGSITVAAFFMTLVGRSFARPRRARARPSRSS